MNKNIADNDIDIELDFDFTPIGLAIKKAREAKKITREQLVESLGISTRHLQSVENEGQFPSFKLFIKLITMFDVSVGVFVFPVREDAVKHTVFFRFLSELFQVVAFDGKDFQFLTRTEHTCQPCFAFGFLFFFKNGIQQDSDVLRTCTCNFGSDLKALQAHSDDLFCRFAACVHSSYRPQKKQSSRQSDYAGSRYSGEWQR